MKAFILTLLIIASFWGEKNCEKLEDGRYRVKFKSADRKAEDFELKINKVDYTKTSNTGIRTSGKIEWRSDCLFILDYLIPKPINDSSTNIQRSIASFGSPCFEIDREGQKIYFRLTYIGNLHITLGEGEVIRLKK